MMYSKGNMWSSTLTFIKSPTFSWLDTESHTWSGANTHAEGKMPWPGKSSLHSTCMLQEKGMPILALTASTAPALCNISVTITSSTVATVPVWLICIVRSSA